MSASLELQASIVARLKAWPSLRVISGDKVFDRVPPETTAPYVEIGQFDDHRNDVECVSGRRIYVTIHVWSNYSTSRKEAVEMSEAVEVALNDAPLALLSNRLISIDHLRTQVFQDLDGIHYHGVVEFIARTEAA